MSNAKLKYDDLKIKHGDISNILEQNLLNHKTLIEENLILVNKNNELEKLVEKLELNIEKNNSSIDSLKISNEKLNQKFQLDID